MLINIALLAVILLSLYTAARLLKVFEFSAILRGRKPYEVTPAENNTNAFLLLLSLFGMFTMFIYLTAKYFTPEYQLPVSASEHGKAVDDLLMLNFYVITLAFFLTQTLLLWFAYKYRYNKNRRATHYAHNNKLELVWTLIPALVMAVLVLKGLLVWNDTTERNPNAMVVELYARQFDWTARYAGSDNTLGTANYTMINDANILGLITEGTVNEQIARIRKDSADVRDVIDNKFPNDSLLKDQNIRLRRMTHQLRVLYQFQEDFENAQGGQYATVEDDIVVRDTIYLPKGVPVTLEMRSQDVIHSAYMPHFRVHMYCVPGSKTYFNFTPVVTTSEMRGITGKKDFEYWLYCNNICGATHFNMMMPIRILEKEEYDAWVASKTTFGTETRDRLAGTPFAPQQPLASRLQ